MGLNDSSPSTARPVRLREVIHSDLPIFFEQQLDPRANHMAAFTASDPTDREAFLARWTMMLANETILIRTILAGDEVAGHVLRYEEMGRPEVSYWLGKAYWGRGIASQALASFVTQLPERPLFARVAQDNLASLRVLQKNGFRIVGTAQGYANARGVEVAEYDLALFAL